MCKCCVSENGKRKYCGDLEPISSRPFNDNFLRDLFSVQQVRGKWKRGSFNFRTSKDFCKGKKVFLKIVVNHWVINGE